MNDPYTKKWLLNDSKYPPIACFVTIATPSCRLVSFSAFESGMVGFVQFNVSLSWFTVAYYVLFCCFCYSHLSILFALVPSSVAIATSDVLLHFFFVFYVLRPVEKRKREKKRCVYPWGWRDTGLCCHAVCWCCIMPPCFSLCLPFLPLADHIPRSFSTGPSSPARGHVGSPTDCTICSGLGTAMRVDVRSHAA